MQKKLVHSIDWFIRSCKVSILVHMISNILAYKKKLAKAVLKLQLLTTTFVKIGVV